MRYNLSLCGSKKYCCKTYGLIVLFALIWGWIDAGYCLSSPRIYHISRSYRRSCWSPSLHSHLLLLLQGYLAAHLLLILCQGTDIVRTPARFCRHDPPSSLISRHYIFRSLKVHFSLLIGNFKRIQLLVIIIQILLNLFKMSLGMIWFIILHILWVLDDFRN